MKMMMMMLLKAVVIPLTPILISQDSFDSVSEQVSDLLISPCSTFCLGAKKELIIINNTRHNAPPDSLLCPCYIGTQSLNCLTLLYN